MKIQSALLASALLLAACNSGDGTGADPVSGLPAATPDQQYFDCIRGGDPSPLIGLPANQAAAGHKGAVRVIQPGQVVVQDYDIKRLNLRTNNAGIVQRAYCG
ncbi:MAG: I78 family peptidase inhibitor [Pseudomonadota bacterium]